MAQTDRESDRFMLRLPDGMRDRIKSTAAKNGRSMNAEIVSSLEKNYPTPDIAEKYQNELLFKVFYARNARLLNEAENELNDLCEHHILDDDEAKVIRKLLALKREDIDPPF